MTNEERIAELEAVLRDLIFGANLILPYAAGAMRAYVLEVRRVAEAPLIEEVA